MNTDINAPKPATQDPDLMQLSVHSLPSLQSAKEGPAPVTPERTRAGRLKMLMVLLICAAPVVASYFTYYVIRPEGRTNHGDLILPPVAMPADASLILRQPDGQAVPLSSLKGQWLFVTVAGGQCDAWCEQQLYQQRQIREALGKDKDRVDRLWIIQDGQPMRASLKSAMQGAWVLTADAVQLAGWLKPQAGHALQDHWYVVDPRGQWMMRFPPKAEPRQVFKDLTRLLRAAGAGDEAGRP
jgi:cytochrome oxidase Cu insertion factor (SCO1/SenC/PrrC family)